jgi:hypothetical protein
MNKVIVARSWGAGSVLVATAAVSLPAAMVSLAGLLYALVMV